MTQPWSFIKTLMVLDELDKTKAIEQIKLEECLFWVHIQGLPLGMMTEKIGIVIGETLGEVLEVETQDNQWA